MEEEKTVLGRNNSVTGTKKSGIAKEQCRGQQTTFEKILWAVNIR
jgi:hypothetical protein